MSQEVRPFLTLLAEEHALISGVSVSYLAERLEIDGQRALKIAEMLERAGYAQVQRFDRVSLVSITSQGYDRVRSWQEELQAASAPKKGPPFVGLIGPGLLAVLIGSLIWWFGLFPQAGSLQLADSAPLPSPDIANETVAPTPTQAAMPIPTQRPTTNAIPDPAGTSTATATPTPSPTTSPTASATASATATPSPTASATATPTPSITPGGPGLLPTALPIGTPDVSVLPVQPTAIPTPAPLLEQPSDTVNIVLMGTDTTNGSWRTDTLIIVSVDPRLPSVSMLSIPRDLYVYIPGWKMSRINTADYHGEQAGYPGGGAGLVKATIEYNLGIRVHYFARVDFPGFVNILDTLGGVDIVSDCELHDTFPDLDTAEGSSDIDLLPGVHHLNGKQALWYARSRWNTSDFDRGRRQQRVLRGALAKIKQLELLPKLPELWDELTQTVQTDLSLEMALWLAKVAGRLETEIAIKSRFIDNTVVQAWRTPEGAAVQLPDYARIGPLIADALAPPDTARTRQGVVRVEVLNGTTWSDWGVLAADRLLWEGFDVVDIGQADRADYQQTTLIDMTETAKGSPVKLLSGILRVRDAQIVAGEPANAPADFRVVVGYDFRPCYRTYWSAVHGPTPTPIP